MSLAPCSHDTAADRGGPSSAPRRSAADPVIRGRPIARFGDELAWACSKGLVAMGHAVYRCRDLVFATLATLVFYLPSLIHGSTQAGFMYVGDTVGYYWPMLVKLKWLLSRHHFTALDFTQYNGSGDFFLTPNFFSCHPLFVLWALLTPASATPGEDAFRALVIGMAVHGFVACYFSLRLLRRFFGLDFPTAAFAALAFAFSVPMIHAHAGFPNFVFTAAVLPWAAHAALHFEERPNLRRLLLAALPVSLAFLGGYVPLGAACLAIAALAVGFRLLTSGDRAWQPVALVRRCGVALLPFLVGGIVVLPYLVAVVYFVKASPVADRHSLHFSAHELAELPQTALRILSFRYAVPGPKTEFSLNWGFVALGVFAVFLSSRRAMEALAPTEWALLKACGGLYFIIALAIFGQYSVVSDLFYYFLPQVGKMHIYQRLLLPAQVAFGVMLALMLKAVAVAKPSPGLGIGLASFGVLTGLAAFATGHQLPLAGSLGLNNYIVYELLLATLAMAALLIPGRRFGMVATSVLFTLPALDQMYDYSQGHWALPVQQRTHGVALDTAARQGVVDYLRRFDDREIVKYADITPRWLPSGAETFPKEFPSFVLDQDRLCSFMGFNYYLATRADYMQDMPYLGDGRFHPDWERLRRCGLDFAIGLDSDIERLRALGDDSGEVHRLPHGAVIVPLRRPGTDGPVYDNGFLRVRRQADVDRLLEANRNLALGKPARQSSEGGGPAGRAVDGDVNGAFAAGSVTHTGAEKHAWLEVDLGRVVSVGAVRIWNRAEVSERLGDFWIAVSAEPFAADAAPGTTGTADAFRRRISVTPRPRLTVATPGARGRYVRIQLAGTAESPENILSIAELEVFPAAEAPTGDREPGFTIHGFDTNTANFLALDVEATEPVAVEYLMGRNPRLRFLIDGRPVQPQDRDGLATLSLPAGRHKVEIVYRHRLLTLFWTVSCLFGLAVTWSTLAEAVAYGRGER